MIKTYPAALDTPVVEILEVGPPEAEKLLQLNSRNRSLRPATIEGWTHDMRAENWVLNGETIKVAYDGVLLDGQNRLTAIVAAGVPQRMIVVMGLPHRAQDTIDVGIRRTFGDVLKIRGYYNHIVLASVVRHTFLWARGQRRGISHGKLMPTNNELLAHLAQHEDELVEVTRYASWVYSHFRALPKSVLGLCVWLFDQAGEEGERNDFFIRLIEGTDMKREHPIMALRRLLLQRERSVTVRMQPEMKLAVTIKAWNAYREGRELEHLVWRAGGKSPEVFPTPR